MLRIQPCTNSAKFNNSYLDYCLNLQVKLVWSAYPDSLYTETFVVKILINSTKMTCVILPVLD